MKIFHKVTSTGYLAFLYNHFYSKRSNCKILITFIVLSSLLVILQTICAPLIAHGRFHKLNRPHAEVPLWITAEDVGLASDPKATGKVNYTTYDLPMIYVITPTFRRHEQIPELTRLGQTLRHVPNLFWIVAEDGHQLNKAVTDLLESLGIPYTYILTPMPLKYRNPKPKITSKHVETPRGVANRNGGMKWLRQHALSGVFYMADDDNTYDIRLFEEIRFTKKVSMFPVGLVTTYGLSSPILKSGKFVGWYDGWKSNRSFPVDMAGFAVSVPFFLSKPRARMPYSPGQEESLFLESLNITMNDIEFVADGCTKVYVWHTRTEKSLTGLNNRRVILSAKYDGTNLRSLQRAVL